MSEGFCEVDFGDASDDADRVEFVDTTTVKRSRKAHKCDECKGEIPKGATYQRSAYRFEGDFECERRCMSCVEAAGEFNYTILGGGLWQYFEEEWDRGAHITACIQRLTTAQAKEHMRQQWLKWQERRNQQRLQALARRKNVDAVDPSAQHRER